VHVDFFWHCFRLFFYTPRCCWLCIFFVYPYPLRLPLIAFPFSGHRPDPRFCFWAPREQQVPPPSTYTYTYTQTPAIIYICTHTKCLAASRSACHLKTRKTRKETSLNSNEISTPVGNSAPPNWSNLNAVRSTFRIWRRSHK